MRKSSLIAAAAGLLLALGGAAQAGGGHGLGGGGGLPSGLSNTTGGHNGFNSSGEPNGWDPNPKSNDNAWWKQDTTGSTSTTTDPIPPGLSGVTKH